MANSLLTTDVIARQALATLYEQTAMLPLVYTGVSQDFSRATAPGNTVNVRKPATFTASLFDRATGIVPQDATESSVPVVMDKLADVSIRVTAEDLTLNIANFDEQLLAPATEALAQHIDRAILGLRSDITQVAGLANIPATSPANQFDWDHPEVLIEAGRQLDIKNVPQSRRRAVTGPTTRAKWLNSDVLKLAINSGSTEALRQGSIGQNLFGFDAYMTQNVGQPAASPAIGAPTTEIGVAFHDTAFCFASVPLALPQGAKQASIASYKGISVRVVYDYDIKYKQDVISLDVLYGVKTLDANRAVLLKGTNRVS